MSWIIEGIKNGIWGFLSDMASDFFSNAFKLITDFVLKQTDINQYINTQVYLNYLYGIAYSLLVVAVIWEGFKQNSGGMVAEEEKSLGTIALRTVWAAFLIYFLPKSVNLIFLKLNNALMSLIGNIGVKVEVSSLNKILTIYDLKSGFMYLGALMIVMLLILSIGFIILAIASGIRYVELVLCVLIAPIVAVGVVRNGDSLQVWIRETVAITFTQCIHLVLLQMLLTVIGTVQGPMMIIICIGILVVMLQGPKVLRTFLYSSGVGSATVGAVGSGGRMAAMKYMMASAAPTAA